MAKSQRTQLTLPEDMEKWIDNYQAEKGFQFRKEAIRDLLAFAIRIKENAKNDDSISNRELLEEILNHVLVTEQLARTTLGHSYIEGKLKDAEFAGKVKVIISKLEQKAEVEKSSILTKE